MADVAVLGIKVNAAGAITATKQLGGALDETAKKAEKADKSITGLDKAASQLKKAFAGAALLATAKQVADLADSYSNLTSRLRLVTDGSAQLERVQKALFESSQRTRTSFESTAELYQRIAGNSRALGLSEEKLLQVTESINKALVVSGTSAAGAQAALVQLGQGFASGTLRGEELNSILEQAPGLAEAIAAGLGKTVGDLRSLGEAGKLTAKAVTDSLLSQEKAINEKFGKIPLTIGGAITQVKNSLLQFVGTADGATGASTALAEKISGLAQDIPKLAEGFLRIVQVANVLFQVFKGVGETIGTFAAQVSLAADGIKKFYQGDLAGAKASFLAADAAGAEYGKTIDNITASVDALSTSLLERNKVIIPPTGKGQGAIASPPPTKEYLEASQAIASALEEQRALNAAFTEGEDAAAEISAAYKLKNELTKIAATFTGKEAVAMAALTKSLAEAEKEQRKLVNAKEAQAKVDENKKDNAEKLKKEKEAIADILAETRKREETRQKGIAGAKQELAQLQLAIDVQGKSAEEARKLTNEYLLQAKAAELVGNGVDAITAAQLAAKFVEKTNELEDITTATFDWGDALGSVNSALELLNTSLKGASGEAVRNISVVSGAIQVLLKAQEQAKKFSGGTSSAGQKAGGALGAAGGGFAAGSAVGSQTTNRTTGTLGGAVSGAAAGALAGSVLPGLGTLVGGVIGGITGAIGGFLSSSKNATLEAIKLAAAQKALKESLQGLRLTLSNDQLGAAIEQARAQFTQLRAQTEEAFSGKKNEAGRNQALAEINRLEALRIQQLKDEYEALQKALVTDAEVRTLRAQGDQAAADALAQRAKDEKEIADLIKSGASDRAVVATQAAQLAEAEARLADARERQRRSIADLTIGAQAFSDPRGASDAAFNEAQANRYFDAIKAGATEAELAALRFFQAAESANREAQKLENDRRTGEGLLGRAAGAAGNTRAAEDINRGASQRQELVDAIAQGISPANLALLKFVQFAERSQVQTQRAIEDGTKAIRAAAEKQLEGIDKQIDAARALGAAQLKKLDAQIAATEASAAAQAKRFDEQIAAVQAGTKAQLQALDNQIASARGSLEAANRQVSQLEKVTTTNRAVVEALVDFTNSSKLGGLSPLSPEQKLAEAKAQFEALAAAAQGGDASAAQGLPAAANALLEASRGFNASGAGFVGDFNRVQEVIAAVTQQFGKTLPIDEQALEAAKAQVAGINAQLEALALQKDAITAASDKQIAEIQAAKDQAAEDAKKLLEQLTGERDKIGAEVQAQLDKLELVRTGIVEGVDKQIDQLKKNEEEAHLARLAQDSYWTTYLGLLAENGAGLGGGTPGNAEPTPIVLTPENNPVAVESLVELKRSNDLLQKQVETLETRLATLVQTVEAGSIDGVNASNRIAGAVNQLTQETRAFAQASAVRTTPRAR